MAFDKKQGNLIYYSSIIKTGTSSYCDLHCKEYFNILEMVIIYFRNGSYTFEFLKFAYILTEIYLIFSNLNC